MHRLVVFAILLLLLSCGGRPATLAPPPNILTDLAAYPDTQLPRHLRTVTPTIFYITDRAPSFEPGEQASYSHLRSRSMAFGAKQVRFGKGLDWEALKLRSVIETRARVGIETVGATELVRFPPTPLRYRTIAGRAVTNRDDNAAYRAAGKAFKDRMARELRRAERREVVLYVHGVSNDFEDGADTIANLWHYSGRLGVPLVYTWPADNPGLFGYFSDRESANFSVFHFKETLRLLAEIPGLDAIHIIAHSRGSELVTTGLREMLIAERAAGRNPRRTMKVRNLILAAPDLNIDVFTQRLLAELFTEAFNQITVYMNERDTALGFAQRIMTGLRLGRLQPDDLLPEDVAALEDIRTVHFVDVENVPGTSSHSYFRQNPNVVSDIVVILRTGAQPGGTERPLQKLQGNFWAMHPGYPFGRPKTVFVQPRVLSR